MKQFNISLTFRGLLAFGVLAAASALTAQSAQASELASAKVLSVDGKVSAVIEGGTLQPLKVGQILKQGDRVRTGENSAANLVLSNGSEVELKEDTDLFLRELQQDSYTGVATYEQLTADPSRSQTVLQLNYGVVDADVKKLRSDSSFDVRTPLGTAAIRGSLIRVSFTFSMTVDGLAFSVQNFRGAVDVFTQAGARTTMGQGTETTFAADAGEAAEPVSEGMSSTVVLPRSDPNFAETSIGQANQRGGSQAVEGVTEIVVEGSVRVGVARGEDPAVAAEQTTTVLVETSTRVGVNPSTVARSSSRGAVRGASRSGVDVETVVRSTSTAAVRGAVNAGADVTEVAEVARESTRGAVEGAAESGEDSSTVARGASSGAVQAAAETGQDTSAVARESSRGAVQGAAETGQDSAGVARGASSGAVQAAAETGQDVSAVARESARGAVEGAAETGQDTSQVAQGANEGAVEAAEATGQDSEAVSDAANEGAGDAADEGDAPDGGDDAVLTPEDPGVIVVSPEGPAAGSGR